MKVGEVGEAVATDIVSVFRWIERHYKNNRGPAEKGQITKQSRLDQVPDTRPLGPRGESRAAGDEEHRRRMSVDILPGALAPKQRKTKGPADTLSCCHTRFMRTKTLGRHDRADRKWIS